MQKLDRTDSVPSFLVIGATKCGTESLHAYLSRHPEVFIHPKELRFFTREFNLERGAAWYRDQFSGAGSARATGEGSNAYTRDPVYGGVAARIQRALPSVRMIYVIRHPDRADQVALPPPAGTGDGVAEPGCRDSRGPGLPCGQLLRPPA